MINAERKDIRAKYRAYLERYTRDAHCIGMDCRQEALQSIDPKLSLRYDVLTEKLGVYYDHHGLINCINIIELGEPWAKVFNAIRANGRRTKQDLIVLHQLNEETQKAQVLHNIHEAADEFKKGLDNIATQKVTMTV